MCIVNKIKNVKNINCKTKHNFSNTLYLVCTCYLLHKLPLFNKTVHKRLL